MWYLYAISIYLVLWEHIVKEWIKFLSINFRVEITHELGNEKCCSVKKRKGIPGRRKKYTKVVWNDQWKINFWFWSCMLRAEKLSLPSSQQEKKKKKSWTNLKSTTLLRCFRELRSQVKLPAENWETEKLMESVLTGTKSYS